MDEFQDAIGAMDGQGLPATAKLAFTNAVTIPSVTYRLTSSTISIPKLLKFTEKLDSDCIRSLRQAGDWVRLLVDKNIITPTQFGGLGLKSVVRDFFN